MRAIAYGEHNLSGISGRAGLDGPPASKYLSILRETGFVEWRVSVTERFTEDSRKGQYYVTDPYLRFYFRYLAAYQSKLALGQQQQLLDAIEQSLPEFIQDNTWQELCREWLLLASAQGQIPVPEEHVGSEWTQKEHVFDVVGISEEHKSLVLGYCHWGAEPIGVEAITDMVRRTPAVLPKKEDWQVYYVGFASGGWKKGAIQEAEEAIAQEKASGRRRRTWRTARVKLLDLAKWMKIWPAGYLKWIGGSCQMSLKNWHYRASPCVSRTRIITRASSCDEVAAPVDILCRLSSK